MKKEIVIKNKEVLKEILIFVLLIICILLPVIRQFTHNLIFCLNNETIIIKTIGLIGIFFLTIFICINYKKSNNPKEYIKQITPIILFTLYMVWTLITSFLAQDRHLAFYGTDNRKEGYFIYIAYAGIFSLALSLKNENLKKILLNVFVLVATITITFVELRKREFLSTIIWTNDIAKGPFFNLNHYGYYLMMATTIANFLFITEKNKLLKCLYLLIYTFLLYYLIINNTFGSYLALFFSLLVFFIIAIIKKEKRILALLSIIVFAGISIFTQSAQNLDIGKKVQKSNLEKSESVTSQNFKQLSTDISKIKKAKENPENNYQAAGSGRLALWINGLRFFIEKPIFGYGPENLEVKYKEVNIIQDRPHNLIIQLLTTSGLPGCILYLSAIGIMLIRSLKNIDMKDTILVISLFTVIAYLGSSMFGNSMYYTSPYFYIMLGFLMRKTIIKNN